jgi:hypothetical protein
MTVFVPILSRISPVYGLSSYFFTILFNSIFPSAARSAKWALSFRFPDPNRTNMSLACEIFPWPSGPKMQEHQDVDIPKSK